MAASLEWSRSSAYIKSSSVIMTLWDKRYDLTMMHGTHILTWRQPYGIHTLSVILQRKKTWLRGYVTRISILVTIKQCLLPNKYTIADQRLNTDPPKSLFLAYLSVQCEFQGGAPHFPHRAFQVDGEEERQHGEGTPASQPTGPVMTAIISALWIRARHVALPGRSHSQ